MKHNTAELEGALLDAAVAKAEGCETDVLLEAGGGSYRRFEPSSNWEDGGPIIERERIATWPRDSEDPADGWSAAMPDGYMVAGTIDRMEEATGPTPLIAAMRAKVAKHFGEEVELP